MGTPVNITSITSIADREMVNQLELHICYFPKKSRLHFNNVAVG